MILWIEVACISDFLRINNIIDNLTTTKIVGKKISKNQTWFWRWNDWEMVESFIENQGWEIIDDYKDEVVDDTKYKKRFTLNHINKKY